MWPTAMLASRKKIVVCLSVICVLLIVVEEIFQRFQAGSLRFQPRRFRPFKPVISLTGRLMPQLTILDSPSPNASYDINKEAADVRIDQEQEQLTDIQRNSVGLSRHRNERIPDLEDGVHGDSSNRSQGDATPEDDLQTELEEEEERRLRKSPYIYLEDHSDNTISASYDSTSVKLVSYFRPRDSETFVPKSFRQCGYECRYVRNMSQADAVLFQAALVRDNIIPPFYRPAGQRWVFFTSDPAIKMYNLERSDVKAQFNWTMTYQLDSDFPTLFGHLQRRRPPEKDYEMMFDRKSKMAAWFVSHCSTWGKRELYVERMRRVMGVDIFGQCGNLTCGPVHYRQQDSRECLPMLSHHYKFYLAFENSFCPDYVTEKFFKLFQNVDVVPVVRGGFDYKRYFPSGIFVDASDFKTPEDLARYLLQLASDKHKYVAMLRRKSQWWKVGASPLHCRVCEALHTSPNTTHYYPNLRAKFNGIPPRCRAPRDLD